MSNTSTFIFAAGLACILVTGSCQPGPRLSAITPSASSHPSLAPSRTVSPPIATVLARWATEEHLGTPTPLPPLGILPPGEYLAYCGFDESRPDDASPNSLYLVSRSGLPLGRLLPGQCYASLSPSGKYIAYSDASSGGIYGETLVVMELALGTERRIPLNEQCNFPTWSPDEAQIAVECLDGNIHVVALDASRELVIRCGERGLGICRGPQWSPDGRYIAWNAGEPFGAPLTLRLTYTSCLPNVAACADSEVVLGRLGGPLVWAPNSQLIAGEFFGKGGNPTLGFVNIHDPPSLPPTLITVADPVSLAGSPDGRFLAFTEDGPFEPDPIRIVPIDGGDVTSVSVPEVGAKVQFWFQVSE